MPVSACFHSSYSSSRGVAASSPEVEHVVCTAIKAVEHLALEGLQGKVHVPPTSTVK